MLDGDGEERAPARSVGQRGERRVPESGRGARRTGPEPGRGTLGAEPGDAGFSSAPVKRGAGPRHSCLRFLCEGTVQA